MEISLFLHSLTHSRESRDSSPAAAIASRSQRNRTTQQLLASPDTAATEMACYGTLLHQPLASLSPCSSSPLRPGALRAPRLQLATPLPSLASSRGRVIRISPRCSYSSAGAAPGEPPAAALRRVLEAPGAHQAPACYDALSARLVELAGFRACFTSGVCSSQSLKLF
jgi:hypothetical protein